MAVQFDDGTSSYSLGTETGGEGQALTERETRRVLERWLARKPEGEQLRSYATAELRVDSRTDDALIDRMLAVLSSRRVTLALRERLVPRDVIHPLTSHSDEGESEPLVSATSWIDIRVIDDVSGDPVPGLRLTVSLADGSQQVVTTSMEGLVALRAISDGTCSVTSELGHAIVGDVCPFVGMGSTIAGRSTAPVLSASMGAGTRSRVAEVVLHHVATGQTLDSIAASHGLTGSALARFNFGTTDPASVAERTAVELGCTHFDAAGRPQLDDTDDPGVIYIPRVWTATGLATGQEHVVRVRIPEVAPYALHVDADRDGIVDPHASAFRRWTWGPAGRGAVVMVNCDDDDGRDELDNANNVVNGGNDGLEIAPVDLRRASAPNPATGWTAVLRIDHATKVRVFDGRSAGATEVIGPNTSTEWTLPDLTQQRIELGMEALEFAGPGFDGLIRLSLQLTSPTGSRHIESTELRVSPWLIFNHTDAAETVYVIRAATNQRFRRELAALVSNAGCSLQQIPAYDIWMQDCLEPGHCNLPAEGIAVMSRGKRRRGLGHVARSLLRADVGFYDLSAQSTGDENTFDSTGNLECTPPCTSAAGKRYPLGRIYYGPGTATERFDANVATILRAQMVQEPFTIDTSWLRVGHVDEVVSFVPGGRLGSTMLIASPSLAYRILQSCMVAPSSYTIVPGDTLSEISQRHGMTWQALWSYDGGTGTPNSNRLRSGDPNLIYPGEQLLLPPGANPFLEQRSFPEYDPTYTTVVGYKNVSTTVSGFLTDGLPAFGFSAAELQSFNDVAQRNLDGIRAVFEREVGLDSARGDIVEVPILFMPSDGRITADALTAGMVNMLVLNGHCIIPKPFGPQQHGLDLFEDDLRNKLAAIGQGSHFIDDWYEYHVNLGEVHCGTNTLRRTTAPRWWDYVP